MQIDPALLEGFRPEVYLAVLNRVARADGSLHEAERSFITTQATALGLDPDAALRALQVDQTALAAAPRVTKMAILRDAIVLARADGDYAESEEQRIRELAEEMGLSATDHENMEAWVSDYERILVRGAQLLGLTADGF